MAPFLPPLSPEGELRRPGFSLAGSQLLWEQSEKPADGASTPPLPLPGAQDTVRNGEVTQHRKTGQVSGQNDRFIQSKKSYW